MIGFGDFFGSLWRNGSWPNPEPFPWQTMLADRVKAEDWPLAITLPTASGKTACLDIAVYALATADQLSACRMPRRIWIVVDRRVAVDEAYERARTIAERLAKASEGSVKKIADRLRQLSGTGRPLAVARLRGGAWRGDRWARVPSQPAIICSTVDQIGSALLFRAYGHSENVASIFAGLAAHDSLILLDEAHCATPFLQTLRAIAHFRGERWAKEPLKTPFQFSVMSATLPSGFTTENVFPRPNERAPALHCPPLQKRINSHKVATLVAIRTKSYSEDEFPAMGAKHARSVIEAEGKRWVAIMVNRVATAERIAECLRVEMGDSVEVVLLTGRMRPLDRDELIERWMPVLKAGSAVTPMKPVLVVTT